jgi:hypothetical protein
MKLVVALSALSSLVVAGVVGCGGSPSITCQTANCSSGTNTYQVCSHSDGSVSYDFGGMSCSCMGSSSGDCQTCATEVANYCTGGGGAGGGGGGGGAGGGGGGGTCTVTFAGAITNTYSGCAPTITQVTGQSFWTIGLAGNSAGISGTPYMWSGINLNIDGASPATGSYAAAMIKSGGSNITPTGGGSSPSWQAAVANGGAAIGNLSVDISAVGTPSTVGSAMTYLGTKANFTATLHDVSTAGMPDVTVTVTDQ